MYEVSQAFIDAIYNENIQHIQATIKQVDGTVRVLDDDEVFDDITVSKQCTEDAETFCFGQMYVGTAEIILNMAGISTNRFKGGKLSMKFGVDIAGNDEPEWVPLGVWDISEATRETGNRIQIKALDHLNRLQCNTTYSGTGYMGLDDVLEHISTVADVVFAQTAAEISAMINEGMGFLWKMQLASTCWEEVQQIAQMIGGFAFANREGQIEFKQFKRKDQLANRSVLTIPANKRIDASLAEYMCELHTLTYTDGTYTCTYEPFTYFESGLNITIENNGYFHDSTDTDYAERFNAFLIPICEAMEGVNWIAGTIRWYGNPALDLGDTVSLTGGVAGNYSTKFLITADTWQFRAPQTLISAGASEGGMSSSSTSGGTAAASVTYINTTKVIGRVDLAPAAVQLYEAERVVASGGYSVKAQSCCFAVVQLTLLAEEDSTAGIVVYHDNIAQDYSPILTLHEGEYQTISVSIPIDASTGTHTVRVSAYGKAVVTAIQAYIWGQELHAESPQYTSDSDYTYTVSNGITTVTGYIGSSLYPEIPATLGGGATTIIDDHAFIDAEITAVYIPEGVTEIR